MKNRYLPNNDLVTATGVIILLLTVFSIPACVHDPVLGDPVDPIDTMMMGPDNACDPDSIYFASDVLPIIRSSCGMGFCHDDESKRAGIELTSYETLVEADIVVPFEPENSKMYEVMTAMEISEIMPPSPRGPISDDNIETIRLWIAQGAQNNECFEDTACQADPPVSFAADVFPVIDKYCIGCHSGNNPWAGLPLKTYEEIKVIADNGMLIGVIDYEPGFPPMPKDLPKLRDCVIDDIRSWVEAGAPDN